MNPQEQKNAAQKFVERWSGKGYEKGETQPFWLMLLREVFGVYAAENFIFFEEQVKVSGNSSAKQKLHTNFIDARIPQTKVLIEQKSSDKDLDEPGKQADGSAVMAAYSFADDMPEQEVVAALMERYQRLIEEK